MAWQDVTYNAVNFTTDTGTWTVDSGDQLEYRWVRSGPGTMHIRFRIATTDVSGSPIEFRIAIPGGFLARGPSSGNSTVGYISVTNAGVLESGSIRVGHGNAFLKLITHNTAAWTNTSSDNTTVSRDRHDRDSDLGDPMQGNNDVIELSADEVRTLDADADALRARSAGLPFPCENNLDFAIEWLRAHPLVGAVRLHLQTATIEPIEEAK